MDTKMLRRIARFTFLTLFCGVLLLFAPLVAPVADAAPISGMDPNGLFGRTIPLADVLAPDGTLNVAPGQFGAIDLAGYQGVISPGGAPRFGPTATGNWATGFHVNGMNNTIWALAVDGGGNLYAGGSFTAAGACGGCNHIAKWDGTTWSALGTGMDSEVRALTVDSGGNLYAGGYFTTAGTCSSYCNHIAKWNGSTWSPLDTGVNSVVYALAVDSSNNLYAGGYFSTAGTCSSGCVAIAKWNGSIWSALSTGMNWSSTVYALAFDSGGNLYAGGEFTTAGTCSSDCKYIAKWNGSTWSALSTGMNNRVYALAFDSGGNLYAGGYFTTAGTCSSGCYRIAKWDGSTWSALSTGMDSAVWVLAFDSGGNLYAGGSFYAAGMCSSGCNYIAKWDGSTWSALSTGMNYDVNALAFDSGGNLYAGGGFYTAGTCASANGCKRIAKWNGSTWSALGAVGNGMDSEVRALAVDSGGNLYAGGYFTAAGTCSSGCVAIAKWNGSIWSPLSTGVNGYVYELAVDSGGNLYAGGVFTTAGTCSSGCNYIAKWDGSTWSALGTGMNSTVTALAFDSSGNLYAGGYFTTAGTCSSGCNRIAKWDGSTWSALDTGMNSAVYALAFDSSGNLYAGGEFTAAGTCSSGCNRIAKWDGSTWSALSTGMSSAVTALAVDSSDNLYAGGNFFSAGTCISYCLYIAKWNGSTWSALSTSMNSYADALAFDSDGNLYAGGPFSTAGACGSCYRIAKWDGSTWSALGTGMNSYSRIWALAMDSSNNLYAGGDFITAGGIASNYIAKWIPTTPPCAAQADGNWNTIATWDCGHVPIAGDSVVIGTGRTVTLDVNTANLKDVTLGGTLTHNGAAHTVTLIGNWSSSGTFTPGTSIGVIFGGSGTQNLTATAATTFYNLTVNSGVVLVETVSADNATVSGTLTNSGTIRKAQAVSGTGVKTFGLAGAFNGANLSIDVTTQGTLSNLQVDRIDSNHPNSNGANQQTGRYWTITPTNSGYTADLTLPRSNAGAPSVCRYYSGTSWWCAIDSSDSNSVTRNNISEFSDWAVGNNAPTAATLTNFSAKAKTNKSGKQVVLLKWETGNESNVVGFNLYRATKKNGTYKQLNKELLPAKHPGELGGARYKRTNNKTQAGETYFYKIEIVLANGAREWSDVIKIKMP